MSNELAALPEGWNWTTIREIAQSMQNGIYKAVQFYNDDGIACLRMYNIEDGEIVWKEIKRMILTQEEADQYQLKPGDILINRVNSRELVGKAAVIPANLETCVYESKNIRLRLLQEVTQSEFVNYWFRIYSQRYFNQNAQQTVGMASINQEQIGSMPIPLPPINEQKRIVAKIEELRDRHQSAKQALEAVPKLCDRFRQSVLAAAFRGDLTADWREENPDVEPASALLERIRGERRKQWEKLELEKAKAKGKTFKDDEWKKNYPESQQIDFEELPDLPEGWKWVGVSDLISPLAPLCYGVVQPGEEVENGIPLIRVCDLDENTVVLSNLRSISKEIDREYKRSKVYGGELLVSIVGTIGRTAIVPEISGGANIARAIARLCLVDELITRWLNNWLQTETMQDWLVRGAREVARKTLNLSTLETAYVPLAPRSEMELILSKVESSRRLEIAVRESVENTFLTSERLDQSILAKAFRGELVEQDPNDEPASVLLDRIRAEREQAGGKAKGKRGK